MTFKEMLNFTVEGGLATCDAIGDAWISYPFYGWRINFPKGSSSGLLFDDAMKAAEWREYAPEAWPDLKPKQQGWAVYA